MACTTRIEKSLLALSLTVSISLVTNIGYAADRGFYVIAGGDGGSQIKLNAPADFEQIHSFNVEGVPRVAFIDATDLIERNRRPDLGGSLRQKASYSQPRSLAKIIHVSDEMKDLGETRAARREAKMLSEIGSIEFGFYRENEAYDVRFPSIVYLDQLRK